MELYTIGHSRHPIEHFLSLLDSAGITVLADVRSVPYSRFSPQYRRPALQASLEARGIAYAYLGDRLGGKPADPTVYTDPAAAAAQSAGYAGSVDFAAVMERPWFHAGIDDLLRLAAAGRCAVLCAEEDPAKCHRHHLVTRYLLERRLIDAAWHIRGDGRIEPAHLGLL